MSPENFPDVNRVVRQFLKDKKVPEPVSFRVAEIPYALVFPREFRVPRRRVSIFPVAPVVRIDLTGNSDNPDNFLDCANKWREILRKSGAVSFARQKGGDYTGVAVDSLLLEDARSEDYNDVAKAPKGVWFHEQGAWFPIMSNQNNAPLSTLAYYAPVFARHYDSVRDYIQENPAPRDTFDLPKPSPAETEEERKRRMERTKEIRRRQKDQKQKMMNWLARLAEILFEEDWNIIWKGTVHTSAYAIENFAERMLKMPSQAWDVLSGWEPNARVDVYYGKNFDTPEDTVSWGYLRSLPFLHTQAVRYGKIFDHNVNSLKSMFIDARKSSDEL